MAAVKDKIREIINDVMNLDINKIDQNKNLGDVEEWDSFNNLMVISELESAFNIKFTAEDIYGVNTITKIINIVSKKVEKSQGN